MHLPHNVSGLLFGQCHHRRQIVKEFAIAAQLEYEKNERIGLENVLQFDCLWHAQKKEEKEKQMIKLHGQGNEG